MLACGSIAACQHTYMYRDKHSSSSIRIYAGMRRQQSGCYCSRTSTRAVASAPLPTHASVYTERMLLLECKHADRQQPLRCSYYTYAVANIPPAIPTQ